MSRIVVTGAPGSGTTTLGRALAARFDSAHFDSDDAFWEPTDPPYTRKRSVAARDVVVRAALEGRRRWVLSGSVSGWPWPRPQQDVDLAVLLLVPLEIRVARLRARERGRFGAEALEPGGAMHTSFEELVAYTSRYETAGMEQRSRALHEAWLAQCGCPVLRIDGDTTVADRVARVAAALG